MGPRWCLGLVVIAWLSGLVGVVIIALMAQLRFCVPTTLTTFTGDFLPLMSLACSDPSVAQVTTFILSVVSSHCSLWTDSGHLMAGSGGCAESSLRGQQKEGFLHVLLPPSCSVHILWYSHGLIHCTPRHSQLLTKVFALLYTVITPFFNPVVYTLRNKEVQQALWMLLYVKQAEMIEGGIGKDVN